jgi:hypothetical protein
MMNEEEETKEDVAARIDAEIGCDLLDCDDYAVLEDWAFELDL